MNRGLNFISPKRWSRFALMAIVSAAMARGADWVQLQTPYFTILSEASEGRTRDWAVQFELFRRALTQVVPLDTRSLDPLTIVLFRSDRRLRPFKPVENGKPALMAGYFVRNGGRCYIAVSIEGSRDDVREIVFHEAVHWHLSAAPRRFPLWFEEGLAEVFGNFAMSGTTFTVGSQRPEAAHYIQVAKPMPFSELMAVQAGGLEYNGKQHDHAVLFYYESWAFMHALLFGSGGVGIPAISKYVSTPPVDPDPRQDIEKGLGVVVDMMDRRLAAYLDHGRFGVLKLKFDRTSVEQGFTITPATDAVMDLTYGYLLLDVHRPSEATPYLLNALSKLESDARAYEALALAGVLADNASDSGTYLRESVKHGSTNYWVYYARALNSLKPTGSISAGGSDYVASAADLMRCVELNPHFIPAFEALALLLEALPQTSADAERVVAEASSRYPGNLRLQTGMAFVDVHHRDFAKARARLVAIEATLANADSPERQSVERLRECINVGERQHAPNDGVPAFLRRTN